MWPVIPYPILSTAQVPSDVTGTHSYLELFTLRSCHIDNVREGAVCIPEVSLDTLKESLKTVSPQYNIFEYLDGKR